MNGRFAVIKLRVVMEISVITLEDNNLIVRPSILLYLQLQIFPTVVSFFQDILF